VKLWRSNVAAIDSTGLSSLPRAALAFSDLTTPSGPGQQQFGFVGVVPPGEQRTLMQVAQPVAGASVADERGPIGDGSSESSPMASASDWLG
jgi:hypothetical protein